MRTLLILLLLAAPAGAQTIPPHGGLMNDFAGVMSPVERQTVEDALRAYHAETTNEFAVVSVASLDSLPIEDYASALFKQWGIGKAGHDNGILLIWAIKERKIRIEVGYGLGERIPDSVAGSIIREQIAPLFKRKEWAAGVLAAIVSVRARTVAAIGTNLPLAGGTLAATTTPTANEDALVDLALILFVMALFPLGAVILWLRHRKQRRTARDASIAPNDIVNELPSGYVTSGYARTFTPRINRPYSAAPLEPMAEPVFVPIPVEVPVYREERHTYRSSDEPSHHSSYSPSESSPSPSFDFGGGDSGGGGVSGDF